MHDAYVKKLLDRILGPRFLTTGPGVVVPYDDIVGRIDGVIDDSCAVEIESRTIKQVRGAVLDLFFHPYPKKLLVIVPVHMHKPQEAVAHCQGILRDLGLGPDSYRVVLLAGSGDLPDEQDPERLEDALRELSCLV